MFSLSTFGFSKLNNAEVTAFFQNVQKAVAQTTPAAIGLDLNVFNKFGATLKKLIDQCYASTGSEVTARMQELDNQRDVLYQRIRQRLKVVTYAETDPVLIPLVDLLQTLLLSKYTSRVVSMPMHEESAILSGFCFDLRDKLTAEQLQTLGIVGDIDLLSQANEAFIMAYNERSGQLAAGDKQITLKLRTELYELYQLIAFSIQFNANGLNNDSASAPKAKACQELIGILNVMIADVKKRYKYRTGNTSEDDPNTIGSSGDSNAKDDSEGKDSGDSKDDGSSGEGGNPGSGAGSTGNDAGTTPAGPGAGNGGNNEDEGGFGI